MDYTRDVQKALDYIEKNLNSKIDTKELAQIVGMSVYHFHRVLRKKQKWGSTNIFKCGVCHKLLYYY